MMDHSGVSWLHDKLRAGLKERREQLRTYLERGVPFHEYVGFIGRVKENERQQNELDELFKDFYQLEDEDE